MNYTSMVEADVKTGPQSWLVVRMVEIYMGGFVCGLANILYTL